MLHLHVMSTRYFRAGVGTVIYNDAGQVAIFKRNQEPIGIWQFQQGGIDAGESPDVTLWRELKEEVGVEYADIASVHEMPGWYPYQDLETFTDHSNLRLGQVHRWYFIKLKENIDIDLKNATDDEFSDWKFTTFEEAILLTSDHKKHVYEQLYEYFTKHIV